TTDSIVAKEPCSSAARTSARLPPTSSNAPVRAATIPGRSAPTAVTTISFTGGSAGADTAADYRLGPGRMPPVERGQPWNAALTVTVARIVAIPGLMVLILVDGIPGHRWWAAGVYAAAAATDSLDGWLARRRGQETVAGAFLDPLADKLLVTAALVCL